MMRSVAGGTEPVTKGKDSTVGQPRISQPMIHRVTRRLIMWGLRGRNRWWWINSVVSRPVHALVPLAGGSRIRLQLGSLIDDTIYEGQFELTETAVFRRLLRPGDTVVDVGANIGLYTLIAAKSVGPSGCVISFEPVPELRARLADNVALNGLTNVTLAPEAVADEVGRAKLSALEDENHGLASLGRSGRGRSIDVEVTTLDHWLGANDHSRVDMLKIDVEGFEADVLGGMSELPGVALLEYLAEGPARSHLAIQLARFCPTHAIFSVDTRNGAVRRVPILRPLNLSDIGDFPATILAVKHDRVPHVASLIPGAGRPTWRHVLKKVMAGMRTGRLASARHRGGATVGPKRKGFVSPDDVRGHGLVAQHGSFQ